MIPIRLKIAGLAAFIFLSAALSACHVNSAPAAYDRVANNEDNGLCMLPLSALYGARQSERDVVSTGLFISPKATNRFWKLPEFKGTPAENEPDLRTVVIIEGHRYAFAQGGKSGLIDGAPILYDDAVVRWYEDTVIPLHLP